ncbi:hypothetical protein [Caballeronia sp. BR00000012568055]|uniref:hypothetical protein n=1 Tax=Caballeronia sp. BR00000012568055 TaxID=2918761 RepID=UPI0023F8A787|nr:hypothetical protein [Caballeronia sp. BR00000012568055]
MKMKRCALSILFAIAVAAPLRAAVAQDNDALVKQAEDTLAAAPPVHIQATILSIDRGTRMVTVRGPRRDATLVISKDVTNFDQLHVGDKVDVLYKNAVLLTADKVTGKGAGERARKDSQSISPASGANGESGFTSSRQTEVVATVENVDVKRHKITLRGPWHTETIDLLPQFESQKFKKGDTVHAVFMSAAVVKVTPVAAAK